MQISSFFGDFRWTDVWSLINPFDNQVMRDMEVVQSFRRDVRGWERLVVDFESLLVKHGLNVKCVSGEANVIFYNDDIYNKVVTLSEKYPDRKITVVADPVVMTRNRDGRSQILELFKKNLVDLYCRPTQSPFLFRIGGGNEDEVKDLCIEQPYGIGGQLCPRRRIVNSSSHPDIVVKYEKHLETILTESRKITSLDEANKYFLFVNGSDMRRIKMHLHDKYGGAMPSLSPKQVRDKPFFLHLMKKLKMSPHEYA